MDSSSRAPINTISSDLLPPPQQNPFQTAIGDQANHHHQPAMNEPEEENEYAEEEMEDYNQSGGETDDEEEEERPQLAEGFYEIEAIRKKRIRKAEPQYLIKWRGWPEATNTWEPIDNLLSCPDVIEAFEESLRSKKQRSSRKGKRKQSVVVPTPQSKKRQKEQSEPSAPPPSVVVPTPPQSKRNQNQQSEPSSPPPPSYDIPTVKLTIIEEPEPEPEPEPLSVPSVPDTNLSNGTENPSNDSLSDFAIHIQEDRPTEGFVSPAEVSPADGRVGPPVGSRRRKSCAVKRFKKEANLRNDVRGNRTGDGVVAQDGIKDTNGLESDNIVDAPTSSSAAVTEIINPVEYSTSIDNDTKALSVSFLVRRSDGKEAVVDNKYLKENNPILLINFYEQHLEYARFFE